MIIKRKSATKGIRYKAKVHASHGDYVYGPTRAKQSEAKADERRLELEVNELPQTKGTVQDFTGRWLDDYARVSRSGKQRWGLASLRNMRGTLRRFEDAVTRDGKRFGDIELRRFPSEEARPWAARSSESDLRTIRTMFNDALEDKLVKENPFAGLRLEQSKGRRDIVALSEEEVHQLAAIAVEKHKGAFGHSMKAAILTLGYVGCRPGELFALKPEDLHLAEGTIDVRRAWNGLELKKPKNGKERLGLILPPPAVAAIAEAPARLGSDWQFETKQGKQFRQFTWYLAWNPIRELFNERLSPSRRAEFAGARGKDEMDAYELRHTAATTLLDRAVSPEDVAWQLGHTDGGHLVRTLYGHPDDEGRRRRIRQAFQDPPNLQEIRERKEGNG